MRPGPKPRTNSTELGPGKEASIPREPETAVRTQRSSLNKRLCAENKADMPPRFLATDSTSTLPDPGGTGRCRWKRCS